MSDPASRVSPGRIVPPAGAESGASRGHTEAAGH